MDEKGWDAALTAEDSPCHGKDVPLGPAVSAAGTGGVLVAGTLACDNVVQVDALPVPDGFARVLGRTRLGGGSAANVAVQLARLGAPVAFAAAVGDDACGRGFRTGMEAEGVDVGGSLLAERPGMATTQTTVLVDQGGARSILLDMGDAFQTFQPDEDALARLAGYRLLYTDLVPRPGCLDLVRRASELGIPCWMGLEVGLATMEGLGWTREALLEALALADVVLPCSLMARDLGGTQAFLAAGARAVVETRGDQGAILTCADGNRLRTLAAPLPTGMSLVDTTGAGDSFTGALIWAYGLGGMGWEESLAFAAHCAAYCCCGMGARRGPSLTQARQLGFLSR